MKLIEIIQSKEHDLTIFLIYEKITKRQNILLGINFHCGVDFIDSSFAVVDEELTKIYTNKFKCNLLADKIDIALESIYEKMNKDNETRIKKEFEARFHDFLQEQRFSINFKSLEEREVIIEIINNFFNKIDEAQR